MKLDQSLDAMVYHQSYGFGFSHCWNCWVARVPSSMANYAISFGKTNLIAVSIDFALTTFLLLNSFRSSTSLSNLLKISVTTPFIAFIALFLFHALDSLIT